MRKKLKILEPCHQDWQKMTSSEKGKFCKHCQKDVIDFTNTDRKEILKFLSSNNQVCGRLKPHQLNESYLSPTGRNLQIPKISFFLGLSAILGLAEPVTAHTHKEQTELKPSSFQKQEPEFQKPSDSITIKGKVIDKDQSPIAGAMVQLKGTSIGTSTNRDGSYSLAIAKEQLADRNRLIFSFIGFETQEYPFYPKNRYIKITLTEDHSLMGEVILTGEPTLFHRIGNFFHNLFSNHQNCS
ncbi:MAG: carboxypeptidase-like regulatory domain-containing protein [Christiangramia sp.]|nr:hypothetical protein [Christiangramia sp.]